MVVLLNEDWAIIRITSPDIAVVTVCAPSQAVIPQIDRSQLSDGSVGQLACSSLG